MSGCTSKKDLETLLNNAIQQALLKTLEEAKDTLKEKIRVDFYNKYEPEIYKRTFQLQNSPQFELVDKHSGIVYIDSFTLNYKHNAGEYVVELAAEGFHGNHSIYIPYEFWNDFLDWCNTNLEKVFKVHLLSYGIDMQF